MKKIIVSTIMALSIAGSSIAFAVMIHPKNTSVSPTSTKTTPTPNNNYNPQEPPDPNCEECG